jgi:hypothetical protein
LVPHSPQNFMPSGFSNWHFGQCIGVPRCRISARRFSTKEHNGRGKSTRQKSTSFNLRETASDEMDGRGKVLPTALFRAFQKSIVFEKGTKHRENVLQEPLVNSVYGDRPRIWVGFGRPTEQNRRTSSVNSRILRWSVGQRRPEAGMRERDGCLRISPESRFQEARTWCSAEANFRLSATGSSLRPDPRFDATLLRCDSTQFFVWPAGDFWETACEAAVGDTSRGSRLFLSFLESRMDHTGDTDDEKKQT